MQLGIGMNCVVFEVAAGRDQAERVEAIRKRAETVWPNADVSTDPAFLNTYVTISVKPPCRLDPTRVMLVFQQVPFYRDHE
jgi:hypothetical protein